MTKKFTLLQLFSIVDGRLSTSIDDVYLMLNHIMDDNLMTHHLPVAMDYLRKKNPKWFHKLSNRLSGLKLMNRKGDFEKIMSELKKNNEVFDIPQLVSTKKQKEEFGKFMIENSLLIKAASKGKKITVVDMSENGINVEVK